MAMKSAPYEAYCYAYPHKTSYRDFPDPFQLKDIWREESKTSLFLYIHIPFCQSKCDFCNLFSATDSSHEVISSYVDCVWKQAQQYSDHLGEISFSALAIGGGTPTVLPMPALDSLLSLIVEHVGCTPGSTPFSVEISPTTVDRRKIDLMGQAGVDRISLGVQTFDPNETATLGRAQTARSIKAAVDAVRLAAIPILNIDLIYGIPNQTHGSWMLPLEEACRAEPEEIYLYPLYMRRLTRMGQKRNGHTDIRSDLYQTGRDYLLSRNYEQVSMRMFRKKQAMRQGRADYCCQEDGMIGLGVGARSYTRKIHYSQPYGVRQQSIRSILSDFMGRSDHSTINHGIVLDENEQRRRYLIKSILRCSGLNRAAYTARFASDVLEDFPVLQTWRSEGWLIIKDLQLALTDDGIELSDMLGPSLFSKQVRQKMKDYEWNLA